jgi:hypothetical protein
VALTPAQQEVRDRLLDLGGPRPTFREALRADLHRRLTEATSAIAERLEITGRSLWLTKHALAGIHGCERRFDHAEARGFPGWSSTNARGSVVHRALQMGPFLPTPLPPMKLVDLAIDRIVEDGGDRTPAEWLRTAEPGELADLRADATEAVTKFEESFPPLQAGWRPRVDTPIRHELHDATITLSAQPDLALGRAEGHEARVLIVDLKTGLRYQTHADDVRFYALVETLRLGVPPFRIATFYLDTARWDCEDVTEDLLELTLRRTVDGAVKLAELRLRERQATISPGPACRYCALRDDCDGPNIWAATADDDSP